MLITTFAASTDDIRECAVAGVAEVLLEPVRLARQGTLSLDSAATLAGRAREMGKRAVLVWDVLMTEGEMTEICRALSADYLSRFDAVRVEDVGAAEWLCRHRPETVFQLIVEVGNHNMQSLLGWCSCFGPRLERLVLSIELPETKLARCAKELPVQVEVLGAGRILLFYSPRPLLMENFSDNAQLLEEGGHRIEVESSSEESAGRVFPTVETQHGTLMFLDKDQFILDRLENLKRARLHAVRIDLRNFGDGSNAASGIQRWCDAVRSGNAAARREWPNKTLAPFFKTNRTTALFGKLKSGPELIRDDTCLAQVLSGEKESHLVLRSLRPFSVDQARAFVLPTGEEISFSSLSLNDIDGRQVDACAADQLLVSSWVRKACPGALLRT